MAHQFNDNTSCYVVLDDDGYMSLYTPDGHLVSGNIFLRVQDSVCDKPYVIGKWVANIVSNKKEMFEEIEKYKNQ
jgi:hypothetical protein